jgi:hypothetical protein
LLELLHLLRLFLGEDHGDHLVDPKLTGDPLGGLAVVAGEHHGSDADLLQGGDCLGGGLAWGVGDCDEPCSLAVAGDVYDHSALAAGLAHT